MTNADPTFANFFAMFDVPVDFAVNVEQLNSRLRQLQSQFHPDKSENLSQNNSAIINHAYHVLVNPDSRANYLLELSGQDLDTNASIADLDFLDNAMDMRIKLDEASAAQDLMSIQSLKSELETLLTHESTRFTRAYEAEDWSNAIDATQKLKFLVKLDKDMDSAIDELHQESDNDDDLYL